MSHQFSLERVEKLIPHPALLFLIASLLVVLLSSLLSQLEISATIQGQEVYINNLLGSDGLYWVVKNLVANFIGFAPLGVVIVTMLGIGVAEKTGALGHLIGYCASRTPLLLLSPFIIFIGIFSSVGLDAGYLVLPPIAAQLFLRAGRAPAIGIAAAFAGVSAGFGANILLTGVDPILAAFSTAGIQIVHPEQVVSPTANWYFMIVSTFYLTLVGWYVSDKVLKEDETSTIPVEHSKKEELSKAILLSSVLSIGLLICYVILILTPGTFLYGQDGPFPRWVNTLVPFLFLFFLVFGLSYGMISGTIRSTRDIFDLMVNALKDLAPIIVLCFFAAQFVAFFDYSQIGKVFAFKSATSLASLAVSPLLLLACFIAVTMFFNIFIGSMSAKYALFAPLFIPVFSLLGVTPETTQLAYRIGDSVTNIVTPLNPYFIIILGVLQMYYPKAGVLTLLKLMIPYFLYFSVSWTLLFLSWVWIGLPLGPQ